MEVETPKTVEKWSFTFRFSRYNLFMLKRSLGIPLLNNKSFFLFGPRGVGKTLWLKSNLKSAIYIDLLHSGVFNNLEAGPERLENYIPKQFEDWIIIDEVQKIPQLLNEVHRLITNFNYKFILTGSSVRSLKKLGSNLLAGRALTYRMYPLTCEELGDEFSLQKSLEFGHLPAVYSDYKTLEQEYLQSYIKTYIKEEVQQEGLTRNMLAFSRFLESASFSQGSVLNFSEIAREAAVDRKLVESYFNILEDLLIAYRIPVFTKRAKRKLAAHPKFYFFDAGVFKALRPMGPLDLPEEANGAALETLVLQELLAINHYHALNYEIYYWRTATKLEVDLILYGKKKIIAIEVTHSSRFKKEKLKGLKAFLKDYPQAKAYLFYTGTQKYFEDNIDIIPVQDALSNLKDFL